MPVEISQEVPFEDPSFASDMQRLLEAVDRKNSEWSLLLTTDEQIASLNEQYRKKAGPTDVLSFPQDGPSPIDLLGDVVISIPTAQRQALFGLPTEVRILAIHGLLHLLGFDHKQPEQALKMGREEVRLTKVLSLEQGASLVDRSRPE